VRITNSRSSSSARGSLAPEKARTVRAHLESCARCRNCCLASLRSTPGWLLRCPGPCCPRTSRPGCTRGSDRNPGARRGNDLRTAADEEYRRTLEALRLGASRNAILAGLAVGVVAIGGLVLAPSLLPDAGSLLASLTAQQRLIGCGALGGMIALAGLACRRCSAVADAALVRLKRDYLPAGAGSAIG